MDLAWIPQIKEIVVNKLDLVNHVKEEANLTKAQADEAVTAVLSGLEKAFIAGDDVRLLGFGSFVVKSVDARKGRNPATGAEIDVPATKRVAFKPGAEMKKRVAAAA